MAGALLSEPLPRAAAAGALAVLLFHQPVLGALTGFSRRFFLPMRPNSIGLPTIVSLVGFGGVWGMLLELTGILRSPQVAMAALYCGLFGAVVVNGVAVLVVMPAKGLPAGKREAFGGAICNFAWGAGAALLANLAF
jgi:hypothetical protein